MRLLILPLWFFTLTSHAQPDAWFENAGGNSHTEAYRISATADGGHLLGAVQAGSVVVTKYNSSGDIDWSKRITFTGPPIDNIHALKEINGGPGFWGYCGSGSGTNETSSARYVLFEIDNTMQLVFAKAYVDLWGNCGTQVQFNKRLGNAHRTETGDFLFGMPGNPNFHCYGRTGPTGDTLWFRLYSETNWIEPDGYFSGFGSIGLADGGSVLLNTADGLQIMKIDGSGEILWGKTYSTPYAYSQAHLGAQDSNGDLIITGIHGSDILYWLFVIKLDLNGNILWNKRMDLNPQSFIFAGMPYRIYVDDLDNTHVIAQQTQSFYHLYSLDAAGQLLNASRLEPDDNAFFEGVDVIRSSAGKFIVSGSMQHNIDPTWIESPFVVRSDIIGNVPCRTTPVDLFVEDDPNQFTVTNTGTYTVTYKGETHIVWTALDISNVTAGIDDASWSRSTFCNDFPVPLAETQIPGSFLIHPNPVHRGKPLRIQGEQIRTITLFDATGSVVIRSSPSEGPSVEIPTHDLPGGLYVISIEDQHSRHRYKLIIQ